jgi:hypothetical protein
LQILAGDNFARPLNQNAENLERLLLKPDPNTVPAELCGPGIEFKETEANRAVSLHDRHDEPPVD